MDVLTQSTTSMEAVTLAVLQQPTIYCADNFNAAAGHPIGPAGSDDL